LLHLTAGSAELCWSAALPDLAGCHIGLAVPVASGHIMRKQHAAGSDMFAVEPLNHDGWRVMNWTNGSLFSI
jgi:hypothetical protein